MSKSSTIMLNPTSPNAISSPDSALHSPQWAPPRTPLAPHRLAKLANALGVSTPIPAMQPSSAFMSHSNSLPNPSPASEHLRRSPTPSTASAMSSFPQPTSKYLLHVIPPLHLPHDSEFPDVTTPPPPNASGYHKQFKRGILVPVYPSLHLQLAAIAKEYALPSTAGLSLYLVNAKSPTGPPNPPMTMEDPDDEPGPLLSEEVWRHLWVRVLKAEQREDSAFVSRSATPNPFALGLGIITKSSPNLLADAPPIRSAQSKDTLDSGFTYPLTPSSTPSTTTISTTDLRLGTKSNASSSAHSDPETPDSSAPGLSQRANSLDLPGLHSPSIIPILAKVEFDIDRRKALWYDPWLRSRKNNHIMRAESRNARRTATADESINTPDERRPPFEFKLAGRNMTASPISLRSFADRDKEVFDEPEDVGDMVVIADAEKDGYEPLSDSSTSDSEDDGMLAEAEPDDDDDEEDEAEDATARVASMPGARDPLSDVFGTDAETWAEIRNSQPPKLPVNPNTLDLALTGAEIDRLPSPQDDFHDTTDLTKSEDEIQELLAEMSRPRLSVSIPTSPPQARARHIPPPLVLQTSASDLVVPADVSPNSGSAKLAYLNSSEDAELDEQSVLPEDDLEDDYDRDRPSADSEKREGAFFDDLDLGLDLTEEYDENDPNDRRKSQYLMKAQLDELEKTLAQFSPRELRADLSDDISLTLSPSPKLGELRNSDVLPPTPGLSPKPDVPSSSRTSASENKSWPAVPFSALRDSGTVQPSIKSPDRVPSPPQLAVNGITTSAPKPFMARPPSSGSISAETQFRMRELEEQEASYPLIHPPSNGHISPATESPVIPLSPDPFGRFSSSPGPSSSRQPPPRWDLGSPPSHGPMNDAIPPEYSRPSSAAPSSRFSADSFTGEDGLPKSLKSAGNGGLMSVKSIKKLWRKSNKNSISASASQSSGTGRSSPGPMPSVPGTPTFASMPMPPPPPLSAHGEFAHQQQQGGLVPPPSRASLAPPFPPPIQNHRADPSIAQMHFDQESPYPTRIAVSPRYSARPPSPNYPAPPPPLPEKEKSSVRKSILKWKSSASGSSSQNAANAEPRGSMDRAASPGMRSRRGSNVSNASPPNVLSEIPPSPRVPEHFLATRGPSVDGMNRQLVRSKMPSVDSTGRPRSATSSLARSASPQRSMGSSRDSEETRPSFDVSAFEIVSPRGGSGLSYPYHALDHD
ncbi:hypothetical protein HGRIS_008396 [Hohenbuehelia grisea]|uniref:Uncharacterized protein n=1 Tax=Hohenbuehelia grisea TaxID=104357 RepID=A0ABR3J8A1_9AGAR